MKWLIFLVISLCLVTPAIGEAPYIAVVGNDSAANKFYNSPNYQQFMYDQNKLWWVPVCSGIFPPAYNVPTHPVYGAGCEQFRSPSPIDQPEVCDSQGILQSSGVHNDRGNLNSRVDAGSAGSFEWYVRLPTAPSGEINLVLECGVLQPEALQFFNYDAIWVGAAESGEKIAPDIWTSQTVGPGENPLTIAALPKITAIAYPGPYNDFKAFHLTAFKNPGTYDPFDAKTKWLVDGAAGQVLNGTDGTRILLKSCMDKTVVTKLPVWGQVNSLGETEYNLAEGDIIYVRIDIPRTNTVDIYCHEQSLKVMGIGDTPF
jgi:hypothetical protein